MSIAFHQSATMRTRPASPWRPLDPRTGPVPARPGGTPSGTPAPALAARVPVTPDRFYVPRPGSPPLARPIPNEARAMAQPDGLRTALADRHVVTCSCASGGAGTTTLAAMLARRLARDGADAMLVDADLSDAAGGLDVLLGLEQDEGLRWHTVHAPLGQLNGRALRRQLPQWDGVGVLAYNPWQSGAPEWFEVQAALEALGSLDGTVIVDAGRGAMIGQVPALIEASHVVVAQLSVLGLARARAHIDWLGEVGRRSREQRDRPPGIGQPLAPMAA
ncbi:MAG: septum formation initiator, partial [Bifidobacterium sp.]|nr:septum formation initiator [Bifidobacterium sp.]